MMTVLACILDSHDLALVFVAALVCIAGSWATIRLFRRAIATTSSEKAAWLVLTSVVAGAAIWCTHFIAMLGYQPGVPIGFDPVLTIGSMLFAMVGAMAGFAVASGTLIRWAPAVGGAIVGLSIVAMHYAGMMAYRVQGIVSWDMPYLVGSVMLAAVLSALALHVGATRNTPSGGYVAAGILVAAIVGLHFTGMTAFRVEPLLVEGDFSNPEALRALALAVAGIAIPVVGAGLASHLIDNRARAEASEALSNMSNGLVMVAANGTIRLFNERARQMVGLKPEELRIGIPFDRYIRSIGAREQWSEEAVEGAVADVRTWIAQRSRARTEQHFSDGTILSISCQPMPDGGVILTYDDVTEARRGERQIAHMAFHDALTGLPNRRSFSEQIAVLAQNGSFAMLMLDLDRFKAVNDTLGHAVGDEVLVEAARRLRDSCRPTDLLFRLGGDELAVLGQMTQEQAEVLAERMISVFNRPFCIGEHRVTIGLSIGVTMARQGDDPEFVQRAADLALYKAKGSGRGRAVIYRDGMVEEAECRRRLENDLMLALETERFELHYQPLFSLPGRTLAGFEALLRWHHPERGMVPPSEFIPVAEQSGAIDRIGAWVIDEACRQAAIWPSDLYVSINISPVQLRSPDLLRQITEALDRHGLPPRRIEVEITETAMVENSEQIAAALAGLRALGVRIAMDDFGTGYSSLMHLREYEIDRIKIDRSFINASHTDPNAAAVVRAITTMAKEMAISTTGEGVENEDQLANLLEYGCGTAQGYLLGRPLDARTATDLLGAPAAALRPLAKVDVAAA